MKRFCLNCGNMGMEEHPLLHDGWRCICGFVTEISEETDNYYGYKRSENFRKLGCWVDMDDGCLLILRDEEI